MAQRRKDRNLLESADFLTEHEESMVDGEDIINRSVVSNRNTKGAPGFGSTIGGKDGRNSTIASRLNTPSKNAFVSKGTTPVTVKVIDQNDIVINADNSTLRKVEKFEN